MLSLTSISYLPTLLLHLLPHHKTKAHYTHSLTTLLLLSLPAGLVSFLALFLLSPPCDAFTSRIQALLILSIFVFFSAVLMALFLQLLLEPLHKEQLVVGKRNGFLLLGLGTAWTETLGAFVVLGLIVGVFAGEVGGAKGVGVIGITMVGLLALGVLGLGVVALFEGGSGEGKKERKQGENDRKEWEDRQPKSPMPPGTSATSTTATTKPKSTKYLSKLTGFLILFILITQFLFLVALLGITASAAIKAEVWEGCNGIHEEGLIVVEGGGRDGIRTRTRTVVETSTILTSGWSTVTVLSTGTGSIGVPSGLGMGSGNGSASLNGNGNRNGNGNGDQATITETEVLRTTTTVEVNASPTTS